MENDASHRGLLQYDTLSQNVVFSGSLFCSECFAFASHKQFLNFLIKAGLECPLGVCVVFLLSCLFSTLFYLIYVFPALSNSTNHLQIHGPHVLSRLWCISFWMCCISLWVSLYCSFFSATPTFIKPQQRLSLSCFSLPFSWLRFLLLAFLDQGLMNIFVLSIV
jgi:hypothetical protein